MTQKLTFASRILFLLFPTSFHVMSDEEAWSRLDPLTIWMYFLPMTGLPKISCFHTSFTRQGCLMFQGKTGPTRTTCRRLWEILNLILCTFLSQTRKLDLTYHLEAWLGSFYTSNHAMQACIIKKEHQSRPRPQHSLEEVRLSTHVGH